ncbi:putative E3 ubiquitin-protein ligase HECTD2 [Microtus ochrogaster]|uniref:HECT-type E3 ubiquitin transferase n=1 Tax=Microtus ochrogaster TaxID=79684 RepID=A0A8J6H434_MICOH|nr:putative E3 ubiquitin-protein ligase HECTD2 [Microtus ochrogaster]
MSEAARYPSPGAPPAGAAAASEEKKGKEPEREKLPPIVSTGAAAGLDRGSKGQIPTFSSFVSTVTQKKEATENRSSPPHLALPNIRNVRDLPPLCLDVRQKQRMSVDALPSEVKVPALPEPTLPSQPKSVKDFEEHLEKAESTGNWKSVHAFYITAFDSFTELNAAFKKDATASFNTIEDSGVNANLVNAVFDALLNTPQDIQKSVLKGIINSLLREWKGPRTKDDLRAYFILLQNPQFNITSTYVIYAHLLRQIAALVEADHHFLVHWLKKNENFDWNYFKIFARLSQKKFKQLVERLLQFVSLRLFPAKPEEFPPLTKCSWWIPSASKVLALLNTANNLVHPPLIPYTDFYNSTLDHIDLMEEYHTWQSFGNSHSRFSFCQYPFVISITAKKIIIQRDSEQQMISIARELAHGLKELLSYEGNVEEDFYSTFQLLRPEEVEILVCGSPELDMHALQRSTQYDGYAKTDLTIRYFWDVVLGFPLDLQKKLLHFTTGSDRVPVGGMADLNFKISKNETSTNCSCDAAGSIETKEKDLEFFRSLDKTAVSSGRLLQELIRRVQGPTAPCAEETAVKEGPKWLLMTS